MLESALALARQGFAVFPLTPGAKSPPLILGWQRAATTDETQIRAWWTQWPDANVGIHCAGMLVLDVDAGKGGFESLAALEQEIELEATYEVESARGGRHIYYRCETPVPNGVDVLGRGIDIRAHGGYVVGAGSRTAEGEYTVVAAEPVVAADARLVERASARRVGALRIKAGLGGGPVVSAPGADHLASVLSLHLQFADATFRSVVEARCSINPVLAAEAAARATPAGVVALHESIARMRSVVHDPDLFREEARRFMSGIANASGNRVLAILVEALPRMSGESSAAWDEKQRRSALRSYERVVGAIEGGASEEARTMMAKSLAAALQTWERTAPDELAKPVAWIAGDGV